MLLKIMFIFLGHLASTEQTKEANRKKHGVHEILIENLEAPEPMDGLDAPEPMDGLDAPEPR